MKIGPADGAGTNTNQELSGFQLGHWQIRLSQRLPGRFEKHRAHRLGSYLQKLLAEANRPFSLKQGFFNTLPTAERTALRES
jgi:hypothetical protein